MSCVVSLRASQAAPCVKNGTHALRDIERLQSHSLSSHCNGHSIHCFHEHARSQCHNELTKTPLPISKTPLPTLQVSSTATSRHLTMLHGASLACCHQPTVTILRLRRVMMLADVNVSASSAKEATSSSASLSHVRLQI